MGAICSGRVAAHQENHISELDNQITDILKAKKQILDKSDEKHKLQSFNKVILQFGVIQRAMKKIKEAFDFLDVDKRQRIDFLGLRSCLTLLGNDIPDATILQIFTESDFASKGSLSYKEFVVSLAIVYLIGVIPALADESTKVRKASNSTTNGSTGTSSNAAGSGSPGYARQSSKEGSKPTAVNKTNSSVSQTSNSGTNSNKTMTNKTDAGAVTETPIEMLKSPVREAHRRGSNIISDNKVMLGKAFHLLVDAYLFFDKDASGTISKDEMRQVLKENSGSEEGRATTQFLTQHRWEEMDWNKDGTITFKEFLLAFESWVYEEDDDEGPKVHNPAPKATPAFKIQQPSGARSILRHKAA